VERNLVQAADTDKIVDGFSAFGDWENRHIVLNLLYAHCFSRLSADFGVSRLKLVSLKSTPSYQILATPLNSDSLANEIC